MRKAILAFIDFFYPPFKKYFSPHNFRYLATGGFTFVLGYSIFYIAYRFIFTSEEVDFFVIPLKRENAAFVADLLVVIPISFLLNRYVIFTHSELRFRTQLFRFLNLQWINILMNYVLLKFFVEIFGIYPTISKLMGQILVAGFSYLYQHYFTFSVKKLGRKR